MNKMVGTESRLILNIVPSVNDTIAMSISKSKAMMEAKALVEGLLYLRLPMSNPSSGWVHILPPCDFYTKELEDTIIYLSANIEHQLCNAGALAFAKICTISQKLIGFINVCSNNIDLRNTDKTKIILVHELLHSLGFMDFKTADWNGIAYGDSVINESRRLFDCPSMSRAPLLNTTSHWDSTLVGGNEVMSQCVCSDSYISSITVAVMVDTGRFYAIGGGKSQEWRGGFGCDNDKPDRKIRFDDMPCDCFKDTIFLGVFSRSMISRYGILLGMGSSMILSVVVVIVAYISIKAVNAYNKRRQRTMTSSMVTAEIIDINQNV